MTFDVLIVGQGLAGTALAWQLLWRGARVAVVDRQDAVTSSRIAGGLMTPITGQRLAKSWRLDEVWPAALAFYDRVERETDTRVLQQRTTVRVFQNDEERAAYEDRKQRLAEWVGEPSEPIDPTWFAAPLGAFEMPHTAQLATVPYLDASRRVFAERGAYRVAALDPATDLDFTLDRVKLPRLGWEAGRVVFCQGHDGAANPWFRSLPFKGAKGEILTLHLPGLREERVVNRGIWLLPLGGERFLAGSTFDHDHLDTTPTEKGRAELCARLREFLRLPFEVLDHRAAVRPTIDAGRPVLGLHPTCDRIGFFNGLGSKGSLLAPFFAGQFAEALLGNGEIDPEVSLTPPVRERDLGSLAEQSHEAVRAVLRPAEIAIDATAGNGRDTRFLADLVGPTGRVFAFEIQPDSRARLEGIAPNIVVHADHARLAQDVPAEHRGKVGAVMFNLGYRPGGDRSITTRAEVSVPAIRGALDWLRPGGVLTVLAYTGHPGGAEEGAAVERLLRVLPDGFELAVTESERGKAPSPRLFVVRRE